MSHKNKHSKEKNDKRVESFSHSAGNRTKTTLPPIMDEWSEKI